jgi:hypothetical protein
MEILFPRHRNPLKLLQIKTCAYCE